MQKKGVQKIGEVVNELLNENKRLNKGLIYNRVIQNWSVVMGPTISRSTKSVFLSREGVLFVTLTSSVVRNELLMLQDKIIESINRSVGVDAVKKIVFK